MACPSTTIVHLTVRRNEPELVVPAKSTPHEIKQLSDIDDQEGLRFQVPVIMFYKTSPSMEGEDPVGVIREALAKTLVFYYPFAGRLVEGSNRKLMVDCSGQGVLFIEADANVELHQIANMLQPPCPYLDQFLHNVPGSDGIIGCPLLLIQVTRFLCGGFVLAIRLNHTMCDAPGLVQFLNAMAEFAQGAPNAPSVTPVWQRELLNARNPPNITCTHHEYEDETHSTPMAMDNNNLLQRSFFFGHKELISLEKQLPPCLRNCSKFEIITACVWKCRTIALKLEPNDLVRISRCVNVRGKNVSLLPPGFYGNAFAYPASLSASEMLCTKPLWYALELVKTVKSAMSEEYIKSVADFMVIKGRPLYTVVGNYIVSDTTRVGFDKLDFGWGNPIYGGPAESISLISFYVPFKNSKGEDGIVVPKCLPPLVMERFHHELQKMTQGCVEDSYDIKALQSKL